MNLTNDQWALIQPLLPPLSPFSRGRPPADPRAVLDGIFHKIRLDAPWYDLPPTGENGRPSWQTCYRAYRRWESAGILPRVYERLRQHLREQGGIEIFEAIWVEIPSLAFGPLPGVAVAALAGSNCQEQSGFLNELLSDLHGEEPGQNTITMIYQKSKWHLHLSSAWENTWQGSTALLLVRDLINRTDARWKDKTQ